jgi:hypothetical protein
MCAKRPTASVAIAIEAVVARNNFASGLSAYALAYAFSLTGLLLAGSRDGVFNLRALSREYVVQFKFIKGVDRSITIWPTW